jgi:hypothetical protein
MVELAGKTLYILEELPMGKLHSSMLKSIASKDTMKGRALYKGMQSVRITGKLMINANNTPEIGEEGPVWDRTILIPWDTRYVNDGDVVDIPNYRLPSNNTKKKYIVSLRSAFVTVCLKELHRFLNLKGNRSEDGTLNVNEIPQPECVKVMVSQAKERGFPLKMFVKSYVVEEKHHSDLPVNTFFNAYRGFLRTRNLRSGESLDDIAAKLCRVGLRAHDVEGTLMVDGCRLTENGVKLAEREAINMRVDVPDPDTYAITRAFQRQDPGEKVVDDLDDFVENEMRSVPFSDGKYHNPNPRKRVSVSNEPAQLTNPTKKLKTKQGVQSKRDEFFERFNALERESSDDDDDDEDEMVRIPDLQSLLREQRRGHVIRSYLVNNDDGKKGNIENTANCVTVPAPKPHVRNSSCIISGCKGPHVTV